jgi:hypothetical protein
MQIRCLDCVSRNYLQLWYSLVSLETKIKIPKMASQDNLSNFRFVCATGISGAISLAPWGELGFPYVQIEALNMSHNFGSQHIATRGRLSTRIYI